MHTDKFYAVYCCGVLSMNIIMAVYTLLKWAEVGILLSFIQVVLDCYNKCVCVCVCVVIVVYAKSTLLTKKRK